MNRNARLWRLIFDTEEARSRTTDGISHCPLGVSALGGFVNQSKLRFAESPQRSSIALDRTARFVKNLAVVAPFSYIGDEVGRLVGL